MTQFNAPVRRSGGDLDVYTGLCAVAFLVLAAGVVLMALKNMDHSNTAASGATNGGPIKLVEKR
jgi:hypothetical protein